MTVVRTPEGWVVVWNGTLVSGPFETMAEGWRWIDRAQGQPISRSEDTAEWLWSKQVDR